VPKERAVLLWLMIMQRTREMERKRDRRADTKALIVA
jgi:hypothetical protein